MRTHRSTFSVLLLVTLATGVLVSWSVTPAEAGGSTIPSRMLDQAGYRSVVIGATVVSLASLDLPGPPEVPPVPPTPVVTLPPPPPPPPVPSTSPLSGVWAALRQCESGGNYTTDTGNGYYGAYQILGRHLARTGPHRPAQPGPPFGPGPGRRGPPGPQRVGSVAGLLPSPRAALAPVGRPAAGRAGP